ncbi:uncharacterized protein [Musca autumnalis]|uniref:uncharacterized protein n=1 Tax=Musca autumnalis TaxID=221902 RepID=UPI003CF8BFE3
MGGGDKGIDRSLVKVTCNWKLTSGCPLLEALHLTNADPDVFQRPTNDELIDQNKAVLLNKSSDNSEYCELDVQLYPEYKIQAFSLVCSIDKIEIFQGLAKEYFETVYGEILMDDDYADDELKIYRYDVELQKSGITRLTFKFLSKVLTEICIFGIQIQTAPNPRGITTLLPSSVENCSGNLTPAEKSKRLLEMLVQSKTLKENTQQFEKMNVSDDVKTTSLIQDYIDKRLNEMEERINQRLSLMEERQMTMLNRLLETVGNLERNKD